MSDHAFTTPVFTASVIEPPISDAEPAGLQSGELTQWSLISNDGRASMRLRDTMVIGTGECCDLRLRDQGIAPHHALVSLESGFLYVTPLSAFPTRVDGQPLRGRQRVGNRATLSMGAASFTVLCEEAGAAPVHAGFREDIFGTRAQRSPADAPRVERAPPAARRPATPKPRRRRFGVGSFILVAAIGALVFWFSPVIWHDNPTPTRLDSLAATAPPPLPTTTQPAVAETSPSNTESISDMEGEAAEKTAAVAPREPPAATPAPVPQAASTPEPEATSPLAQVTPAPLAQATPAPMPQDDPAVGAMADADALYSRGALVTPRAKNAATAYLKVLSIAPDNAAAKAKLSEIVERVAADSQGLIVHQRFSAAQQMIDQLGLAIPTDARQLVSANARNRWHVVDLLLRADAMMQKYQIVEPEHDNAVALLREVLRIDPKNAVGDEMLSKAYGLLSEAQRKQIVEGSTTRTAKSG